MYIDNLTFEDVMAAIDELKDLFASIGIAWKEFVESMKDLSDIATDAEESLPPQKYGTRQRKDALFRRPATKIYKADLKRIKKHQPYSRRIF